MIMDKRWRQEFSGMRGLREEDMIDEEINNQKTTIQEEIQINPTKIFITSNKNIQKAIPKIKEELENQVNYLRKAKQYIEAERLEQRVNFDIEMIHDSSAPSDEV